MKVIGFIIIVAEEIMDLQATRPLEPDWNLTGSPLAGEVTRKVTRRGTRCASASFGADRLANNALCGLRRCELRK